MSSVTGPPADHIRRAVLAAHAAVLRSLNARSRRAQLKNGRAAMGELVTILEVLPPGEWPRLSREVIAKEAGA